MTATFGRANARTYSSVQASVSDQPETSAFIEIKPGLLSGWIAPLCFELPLAVACFYAMYHGVMDPQFFVVDTSDITSGKTRLVLDIWSKLAEVPAIGILALFGTLTGAAITDSIFRILAAVKGEPLFCISPQGISGSRFWKHMSYSWNEIEKVDIIQIKAGWSTTTLMMFRGKGVMGWQLNVPTSNKKEIARIYAAALMFEPRLARGR